jgi:hypothetical protein
MGSSPLGRFCIIETTQPGEMEAALARSIGARAFDLPHGSDGFYGRASHVRLRSLELGYCNYRVGAHLEFPDVHHVRQLICLSGAGKTKVNGTEILISPRASCIASEGRLAADYSFDYEQLVLVVNIHELTRKLGAILGFQPKRPLQFQAAANFERPEMQSFRRLVMFLANEIEITAANLPTQVLAELEQTLMYRFFPAISTSSPTC